MLVLLTLKVNAGEKVYLPFGTLAKITTECLVAAGVPLPQAATVADVLVTADARNVPSHGVNRLEMYVTTPSQPTSFFVNSSDTDGVRRSLPP